MKPIFSEIIAIGDELLYGQTLDTNSHWISGSLDAACIRVIRKTTVPDQKSEILKAFVEAEKRADIILITGGLGPTKDDLTKDCLVEYFETDLVLNNEALQEITNRFESRGRELTQANKDQALLPRTCTKITNTRGTAPGMWFEKDGKTWVSMPGVPYEMKTMMELTIVPKLLEKYQLPVIYHQILRTVGVGESWIAEQIAEIENNLPDHIKLAYLPSVGQVKLRLTATGNSKQMLVSSVDKQAKFIRELIGDKIYGEGNIEIEEAVQAMMIEKKLTLATAESCTGGYLAHRITKVPGCSTFFVGGIVSYTNDLKINHLGVSADTLEKEGAVSEKTALAMAKGVRMRYASDIGIATTGVAGPEGGSEINPVGTVWIAYTDGKVSTARKLKLGENRDNIITMAAINTLDMLRQQLLLEVDAIPNI